MKIAFATTDGVNVDEHFGRSGMFAVYDISPSGYGFIETREFAEGGRDTAVEESRENEVEHDNIMQAKVQKLADCKIIYFTNIGSPSAARLVNKGVMPIKVKDVASIEQELQKILEVMRNSPPPWLRKLISNN